MNRAMYWLCVALIIAVLLALHIAGSKHTSISEVVLIILCVPRLHDIGLSGWYVLIGVGIEATGLIVGFSFFPIHEAMAVVGVAVIAIFGLMIWLGCIKGQAEANQWGDPPAPGLHFKLRN